jgi:hypothetical protein
MFSRGCGEVNMRRTLKNNMRTKKQKDRSRLICFSVPRMNFTCEAIPEQKI